MPLDAQTEADLARQKRASDNEPPPLEPLFPFEPRLTFDPFYFGVDREVEPPEKVES